MSKLLMTRVVVGTLSCLLLLAGAAAPSSQHPPQNAPKDAQQAPAPHGGPRSKWWKDDAIKAELRLTPAQSARIEEIFQAWISRAHDTFDELGRREDQLSNLISGNNDITETDVLLQADRVESMRARLNKERTLALFRIRRVLSPEQRVKLRAIQQEQDRQRQAGRSHDHDHDNP